MGFPWARVASQSLGSGSNESGEGESSAREMGLGVKTLSSFRVADSSMLGNTFKNQGGESPLTGQARSASVRLLQVDRVAVTAHLIASFAVKAFCFRVLFIDQHAERLGIFQEHAT